MSTVYTLTVIPHIPSRPTITTVQLLDSFIMQKQSPSLQALCSKRHFSAKTLQPLMYFLSPWICLFWILQLSRIDVAFYVWVFWLSITFSRFIHGVACNCTSVLFFMMNNPLWFAVIKQGISIQYLDMSPETSSAIPGVLWVVVQM